MKLRLGLVVATWLIGAGVLRATVVPAQTCGPISPEISLAATVASAGWIERAQQADGSYLYEYNRDTDSNLDEYNVVRHAGVTMSLYQLAASGDLSVMPAADRGLEYMTENMVRRDDWAAFTIEPEGQAQLGAAALMLAGLGQRRLATGDTQHDELMREVGHFLLVMQRPDGSFLANWKAATGAPDPSFTSKYATGEAFWALALMHEAFPGEGWDVPTRLVADYLSTRRDEVEQFKYPPWADQWAAYGLAEMAEWGLNDNNIRYARSLAERFGFLIRVESQRTESDFSKTLHGRQARAAGMGTWVEGLTSLHHVTTVVPELADLRPALAERIACGAAMLADRQQTPSEAADWPQPSVVEGAWFTNGITRMDDQQHALSGLLRAIPAIKEHQGD